MLEGLAMHEDKIVAIIKEEGTFRFLKDDALDGLGRAKALVQLGTVTDIAKLDLRKGAALNAVQIAEELIKRGVVQPERILA